MRNFAAFVFAWNTFNRLCLTTLSQEIEVRFGLIEQRLDRCLTLFSRAFQHSPEQQQQNQFIK